MALAFLICYFLSPSSGGGEGDLDLRYLLPAYLAAFLALSSATATRRWAFSVLALITFGAAFTNNWKVRTKLSADFQQIALVLDPMPAGKKLFPIVERQAFPEESSLSRVKPFWYVADSAVLTHEAFVPDLFDCNVKDYLRYFCYKKPESESLIKSARYHGLQEISAADQERIAQNYDYVLLIQTPGSASEATPLSGQLFDLALENSSARLFMSKRN